MLHFKNKLMKRLTNTLLIIICSSFVYGQKTDTISKDNFPRHYISINPINSVLLGQAGLTYEYRLKGVGFDISLGYFYPNRINVSRFFIGGKVQYGPYEFYSGYFINPQLKFYLSKKERAKNTTYDYISVKMTYKQLHVDSTDYHVWKMYDTGGDDFAIYRKQFDKANVVGTFFGYGFKKISQHFFTDFNFGAGLIYDRHDMILTGQKYFIEMSSIHSPGNIYPPQKERFDFFNFGFNFSFNIGYVF